MTSEGKTHVRSESPRDRPPSRVIIEGVSPEVDRGRFPIKRTVGEEVVVTADIFTDGHDAIVAMLRHRAVGTADWNEEPLTFLGNDRWTGRFTVTKQGWHEYTIQAWVDRYASWRKELIKKHEAGQQDLTSELLEGAELVREAAERATGSDADWLARAGPVSRRRGESAGAGPGRAGTRFDRADGAKSGPSRGLHLRSIASHHGRA